MGSLRASFHTSTAHLKKGKSREEKKRGPGAAAAAAPATATATTGEGEGDEGTGSKHPTPKPEEPLDFADVRSRIALHDEHFIAALKLLRSGGRFNPDVIGALRVAVGGGGDGATTTTATTTTTTTTTKQQQHYYPLRELAQVVPRGGRTVSILAHEAGSVKAIMSAVQASPDFNQQPQRDPDNELELTLKVEPERREDVQRRAKAACHEWRERVRQVRQRRDRLHAAWRRDGALGPDLKRTADKELDKIIKAKVADIDAAEKEALKAADGVR